MEDYPRERGALVTVVAVEEPYLVVADADSVRYRVKYTPSRTLQEAKPLRVGDVLIVNHVKPREGLTVVERLTTMGRRDGSHYELFFNDQLASTSEPASAIKGTDDMMRLSHEDGEALRRAKSLLEHPSLAAKITSIIGIPIEKGFALLPAKWSEVVNYATNTALEQALNITLLTVNDTGIRASSDLLHKIAVATSGAAGGLFGLPALAVELPVSTMVMLRSIADIARSEGERLTSPEAKLACLEVFAFGGPSQSANATKTGYFAVRASLARALSEAAQHLTQKGVVQEGAPAIVRFLTQVASRFGVAVSEKLAAQAVPVMGAIGGALINSVFMDHFHDMARGHFIIRRLERAYDLELIKNAYAKA
jgi:EcsC protein family